MCDSERKSKKGFSLLELLLVLGIIAALVVAA
ncbi:prepilin-type N-terminal cleavage/methylation domain-containing protein, partial [Salmonella enterica]|nr:prepilin-type N-terminal cleavage/methylation domain-containing protein [Salmonella enterica subsp. enterica serovar Enteritidis]